jgi:hypothetical protein
MAPRGEDAAPGAAAHPPGVLLMSNGNDPSTNRDAAHNQAVADINNSRLPANTTNWDPASQQAYQSAWNQNQQKSN